mmetsp:Transcript_25897/g.52961  ORF Transcript_25897/g.52961 Transcript_25897/m.52961 type:complete len:224 (+) Transcript_25897:208-879(+)
MIRNQRNILRGQQRRGHGTLSPKIFLFVSFTATTSIIRHTLAPIVRPQHKHLPRIRKFAPLPLNTNAHHLLPQLHLHPRMIIRLLRTRIPPRQLQRRIAQRTQHHRRQRQRSFRTHRRTERDGIFVIGDPQMTEASITFESGKGPREFQISHSRGCHADDGDGSREGGVEGGGVEAEECGKGSSEAVAGDVEFVGGAVGGVGIEEGLDVGHNFVEFVLFSESV